MAPSCSKFQELFFLFSGNGKKESHNIANKLEGIAEVE
jgi:hypothetical protein